MRINGIEILSRYLRCMEIFAPRFVRRSIRQPDIRAVAWVVLYVQMPPFSSPLADR